MITERRACPKCNGVGRRFRVGPLWERTAPKEKCDACGGTGRVTACPNHPDNAEVQIATTRFGARDYCAPCAEELSRVLMRAVL